MNSTSPYNTVNQYKSFPQSYGIPVSRNVHRLPPLNPGKGFDFAEFTGFSVKNASKPGSALPHHQVNPPSLVPHWVSHGSSQSQGHLRTQDASFSNQQQFSGYNGFHSNQFKTSDARDQVNVPQTPSSVQDRRLPSVTTPMQRNEHASSVLGSQRGSSPSIYSSESSSRASIFNDRTSHKSDSASPKTSNVTLKVKAEQVEPSLGKAPSKRTKNKAKRAAAKNPHSLLSVSQREVLRKHCRERRTLPSMKSRKAWAEINGVVCNTVTKYMSSTMLSEPDLPTSRQAWDMPVELVAELDIEEVVKEESYESHVGSETMSQAEMHQLKHPALAKLDEKVETPEDAIVAQAPVAPVASVAQVSVAPDSNEPPRLDSMVPVNPLILAFASGQNTSSFLAPWVLDPVNDYETMKFLVNSNFFDLTKGPHGIRLIDMMDPITFKAKLIFMKSPFEEGFTWRALKRFYFCF